MRREILWDCCSASCWLRSAFCELRSLPSFGYLHRLLVPRGSDRGVLACGHRDVGNAVGVNASDTAQAPWARSGDVVGAVCGDAGRCDRADYLFSDGDAGAEGDVVVALRPITPPCRFANDYRTASGDFGSPVLVWSLPVEGREPEGRLDYLFFFFISASSGNSFAFGVTVEIFGEQSASASPTAQVIPPTTSS